MIGYPSSFSRRSFIGRTAALAASALVTGGAGLVEATAIPAHDQMAGGDPTPRDAIQGIHAAMERFPLVAMAGSAGLQELYDVISAVLFHPSLPAMLTDIVVEYGNARYQDLADRFILAGQPVAKAELEQIWRQIGDPLWNAPIYEQFFRTVRAVNWMRPPARRLRLLLGSLPIDLTRVRSSADKDYLLALPSFDAHYAAVVEREVLRKGRRALLFAGGGHLLRGLHADGEPHKSNAASLLAQRHPGQLFVADTLVLPPSPQQDHAGRRLQAVVGRWPRPALAPLAGTWLGATTRPLDGYWINGLADRAVNAAAARYDAQADAVLYLGPGEALTLSQADAAIYHWGAYPSELRRLSRVEAQIEGQPVDLIAQGLRLAEGAPNWFAQFNH